MAEESGWTAYLEDFSLNQTKHSSSPSSTDSFRSPSLVSDAAWYGSKAHQATARSSFSGSQIPRRLNLKNHRMGNKVSSDHDLEDTASSPVNSPRVSSLKLLEGNYTRSDHSMANFIEGKQAGLNYSSNLHTFERNTVNITNDYSHRSEEEMDLKKKGLCLVPVSAFVDYLG